jgi:hypothetical protein
MRNSNSEQRERESYNFKTKSVNNLGWRTPLMPFPSSSDLEKASHQDRREKVTDRKYNLRHISRRKGRQSKVLTSSLA